MIIECPDENYHEVMLGSYNWTNAANNNNYEDCLFLKDKNIYDQLNMYYNVLWHSSTGKRIDDDSNYEDYVQEYREGRYQPLDSDDPDYYITDEDG